MRTARFVGTLLLAATVPVTVVTVRADDALPDPKVNECVERGTKLLGSNPSKAVEEFDKALQLDPRSVAAYYGRGLARSQLRGENVRAALDFTAALALDPTHAEALRRRARLYESFRPADARRDYDRLLRGNPGDLETLKLRAVFRSSHADRAGAIEDASALLERRAGDLEMRVFRGDLRLEAGDGRGAAEDFAKAVELGEKPRASDFRRLGLARTKAGDADGARAAFDRALELYPEFPSVLQLRAELHRGRGDLAAAEKDLARCLELDKGFLDGLLSRAALKEQRGDLQGALADLEEAKRLNALGRSTDLMRALARVKKATGDDRGAADALDKARELEVAQLLETAKKHREAGYLDEAVADFSRALELGAPPALQVHGLRAEVRLAKGDFAGAVEDVKAALERSEPSIPWLLTLRARARRGQGQIDEALADAKKVKEAGSKVTGALEEGLALLEKGAFAEAARALSAASADPRWQRPTGNPAQNGLAAEIHLALAKALGSSGATPERVRLELDEAIRFDPLLAKAYHERAQLDRKRGGPSAANADADFRRAESLDPALRKPD